MALIIYPDADYDSFITVADATVVIEQYTLFSPQWTALTEANQEAYLRIACQYILNGIDMTLLTDPAPDCLGDAQALIAVQDVVYGFSASTSTDTIGALKSQKVATLQVEYYDTSKVTSSASRVPDMAKPCLESLGFTISNSMQTTLGRS